VDKHDRLRRRRALEIVEVAERLFEEVQPVYESEVDASTSERSIDIAGKNWSLVTAWIRAPYGIGK
jgi:hypothetical protein